VNLRNEDAGLMDTFTLCRTVDLTVEIERIPMRNNNVQEQQGQRRNGISDARRKNNRTDQAQIAPVYVLH
jgi:hypothetical protein